MSCASGAAVPCAWARAALPRLRELGGVRGFRNLQRFAARKRTPNFPAKYGWTGFYKGNRCGSLGEFTKSGRFRLNRRKIPILEVPERSEAKSHLKPYVSWKTPLIRVPPQDQF